MSAGSAAALSAGAAQGDARRIGVLFMVGSACFAVASLPGASSLSAKAVGVVYFIGSIFFTTAAFEQLRVARGEGKEVWAAGVQFAGTVFFNVTTFFGMYHHFTVHTSNLLVWSPDVFGSAQPDRIGCLRDLSDRGVCRPGHQGAPQRGARDVDDAGRSALLPVGRADPGEAAAVAVAGESLGAGAVGAGGAAVDDLVRARLL